MRIRSATAIALALGLAAFSSNAQAQTTGAEKGAETPAIGTLPGNKGGEGAAGNFAREKNLIEKRDHSSAGDSELNKRENPLPGNVGGEGHANPVGAIDEKGYTTSGGERPQGVPVEEKLPGNVGGEGSGKTR